MSKFTASVPNRLRAVVHEDGLIQLRCGCVCQVENHAIKAWPTVCPNLREQIQGDDNGERVEYLSERHAAAECQVDRLFDAIQPGTDVAIGRTKFQIARDPEPCCDPDCPCSGIHLQFKGRTALIVQKDGQLAAPLPAKRKYSMKSFGIDVDDLDVVFKGESK